MTIERSHTLQVMDELEALVMKRGWPVPGTPYYLVNHQKMLCLLDQLRASLQDEMDGRFITAFAVPRTRPVEKKVVATSKSGKGE